MYTEKDFEAFYKRWFKICIGSANKFLGEYTESEELVNDAFIGVWKRWDMFKNDTERANYLMVTIKHKCINAGGRIRLKIVGVENIPDTYDHCEINARVIDELVNKINKYIEKLPKAQRRTMELIMKGETNMSIANMYGISYKTVHNQKTLSMKQIIKMINQ